MIEYMLCVESSSAEESRLGASEKKARRERRPLAAQRLMASPRHRLIIRLSAEIKSKMPA